MGGHGVGAEVSHQGLRHVLLSQGHHRQPGLPGQVPGLLQGPEEEEVAPGLSSVVMWPRARWKLARSELTASRHIHVHIHISGTHV